MIIAITGGIGSGKTTISNLLRERNYPVYDTDAAGRKLQDEDAQVREKIISLLGEKAYTGHTLDRSFVATQVFADSGLLLALNAIVHPAVAADFNRWKEGFGSQQLLFMECAVLFEAGFEFLVDKIMVVTAPEELRIERVMRRDGLTREQILSRMAHQISEKDKISKADFVINTDGYTLPEEQIQNLLNILDKNF